MLPKKKGRIMESAPTILWKYICFFDGSKHPPYVMKLFSPLKLQSRCRAFLFDLYVEALEGD